MSDEERIWHDFDLGDVEIKDQWHGLWYWTDGKLSISHDGEIENPNTKAKFTLYGNINRIWYNNNTMNTKSILIDFEDPIELAMKLSEYKLVNSDKVVKTVKGIISGSGT